MCIVAIQFSFIIFFFFFCERNLLPEKTYKKTTQYSERSCYTFTINWHWSADKKDHSKPLHLHARARAHTHRPARALYNRKYHTSSMQLIIHFSKYTHICRMAECCLLCARVCVCVVVCSDWHQPQPLISLQATCENKASSVVRLMSWIPASLTAGGLTFMCAASAADAQVMLQQRRTTLAAAVHSPNISQRTTFQLWESLQWVLKEKKGRMLFRKLWHLAVRQLFASLQWRQLLPPCNEDLLASCRKCNCRHFAVKLVLGTLQWRWLLYGIVLTFTTEKLRSVIDWEKEEKR